MITGPDEIDALKEELLAARAELAAAQAERAGNLALIAHLKLEIAKLMRDRFGPRAERTARLIDQLELHLEEHACFDQTLFFSLWPDVLVLENHYAIEIGREVLCVSEQNPSLWASERGVMGLYGIEP